MGHVTQFVIPNTSIGGHDGSARTYSLSASYTIPHGAIGNEIGPIQLHVNAYRSTITLVTVNGVSCDASSGPVTFPTVLPFDTDAGGDSNLGVTVGIPDSPAWVPGSPVTVEITFDRHAQPNPLDGDRTTVWGEASIAYYIPEGPAGPANLWTWGGNADGQLGDGTTADNPTPTKALDLSDTEIDDAEDIAGGGSAAGTRATVRRHGDKLQYSAGTNADGTLITRTGDPTRWTQPTTEAMSPDHTTRAIWGFEHFYFGVDHVISRDDLDQLYGSGADGEGQQGVGPSPGPAPGDFRFTILPTDSPTPLVDWPWPARAQQIYTGDRFTLVVNNVQDLFSDTVDAWIYAAGDASLTGGVGGDRFAPIVGIPDTPERPVLPNFHGEHSGA